MSSAIELGRPRFFRILTARWPVNVAALLVHAAIQSALLVADPAADGSGTFWLAVAASAIALLVFLWFATCSLAASNSSGSRLNVNNQNVLQMTASRPRVLLWAAVAGILTFGVALLYAPVVPIVLVIAGLGLPAAADERSPLAGFRPMIKAPVRFVLILLGLLILAALSWVLALVLGFFITGFIAAFVTWVWFGFVAIIVLAAWTSLYRSCLPPERPPAAD